MTEWTPPFELVERLERVYGIVDRAMAGFTVACREGCYGCCTCNVTLTRLEAAGIFAWLDRAGTEALASRIKAAGDGRRYRPALTTNGFAKACLSGETVPEEDNNPAWGQCPLLENGRCTIYPVRPLGCRNMISELRCDAAGYAGMPPRALTLANIFLQHVEHLDAAGFSGNLTDMLELGLDTVSTAAPGTLPLLYLSLEKRQHSDKKEMFIRNQPVPAWMIPPEHRAFAAPVLDALTAGN